MVDGSNLLENDSKEKIEKRTCIEKLDNLRMNIDNYLLKNNKLLSVVNFFRNNILHISIILYLFSFYYIAIFTILFMIFFTKPLENQPELNKKSFYKTLIWIILLFCAFELETSTNYLITYFDKDKYNYKPNTDYYFNFLELIFPFWNDLFKTLSDYCIVLPGVANFTIMVATLFLFGIFKRVDLKNANMLIWASFYFKVMSVNRIIRILAYTSTLIPNPRLNCYDHAFRQPEDRCMFILDMLKFRSGGCNDLIVSGHTLFMWISLKFLSEIIKGYSCLVTKIVTVIVLINIIMVRNHYSVDVIMAVLFSELTWALLKKIDTNLNPQVQDTPTVQLKSEENSEIRV